jgi:Zn-dependent peptidase ImmA (M78 family)
MSILLIDDINYFINLLPIGEYKLPEIYILNKWDDIHLYTKKRNLHKEYELVQHIVKNKIFSIYNYEFQKVFLYIFNLPYENKLLRALHGIFCLYHELRHHYQYMNYKERFYHNLPEPKYYNQAWTEKDANEYAAEMMIKNRNFINQRLQMNNSWEIGIIDHKLRFYFT